MLEREIDEGADYTGFTEALSLVLKSVQPVGIEERPVSACAGYVCAEEVHALVNSPPRDVSLKDGFAVKAADVMAASPENPVILGLAGSVFAGDVFDGEIISGRTATITTGAPIPRGADAVVSFEFCQKVGNTIIFKAGTNRNGNIMPAGEDVAAGTLVARRGQNLSPSLLAYLATAGVDRLKVFRKPGFALLSIGDELAAPGQTLNEGQLYASNAVNIGAWLSLYGISYAAAIAPDNHVAIKDKLGELISKADAVITSGGVMHSERDLIVGILDNEGWQRMFRHVRMGPGKGTSFGLWQEKPVFCLSGGPASNGMAFFQLALPGIFKILGLNSSPLLTVSARLTRDVRSRHLAWTEFKEARLERNFSGEYEVTPLSESSRLKAMAEADCVFCKPEGVDFLRKGQTLTVQLLKPAL